MLASLLLPPVLSTVLFVLQICHVVPFPKRVRLGTRSPTLRFITLNYQALFIAAGALLDSSCPNRYRKLDESYEACDASSTGVVARGFVSLENPVLKAIETLKVIRRLHGKYAPSRNSSSRDELLSSTSEAARSAMSAKLRKQLDTQSRETERLLATALAQRKKQNKKGTKLWKAAFDKNAKQTPAEVIEFLGGASKKREDTTAVSGCRTNGGTQKTHPPKPSATVHNSERLGEGCPPQQPDNTVEHSTMPPLDGRTGNMDAHNLEPSDGHGTKVPNEDDEGELNDIHETLLGAAALVGVAAAIGIGAMYFAKRLR